MIENIYAIGLSNAEINLLQILFLGRIPIQRYEIDSIDLITARKIMTTSRAVIINPQSLTEEDLTTILDAHRNTISFGHTPILLFSKKCSTDFQKQISNIKDVFHNVNFRNRLNKTLLKAVQTINKTLKFEWRLCEKPKNSFYSNWYLLDITRDKGQSPNQIISLRIAHMNDLNLISYKNYSILPDDCPLEDRPFAGVGSAPSELWMTKKELASELRILSQSAPFIFKTSEDMVFVEALFLAHLENFVEFPFIVLDELSAFVYGYTLKWNDLRSIKTEFLSRHEPHTIAMGLPRSLAELYALSIYVFLELHRKYDISYINDVEEFVKGNWNWP